MQRVILIVCGLSFVTCVLAEKQVLYVGALMELSNHWYENYIKFFPTIIKHVFEEIENRTDILADYSLQLITKDTQVILNVYSGGLHALEIFDTALLLGYTLIAHSA